MSKDLELLSFENSKESFPKHFHETFCITLMKQGVLGENEKVVQEGNILISHPFEIHSNNALSDEGYTFTTFYISEDLMKVLCGSDKVSFTQQVHNNCKLFRLLSSFAENYAGYNDGIFSTNKEQQILSKLIFQLFTEAGAKEEFVPEIDLNSIRYFKDRLDSLTQHKVNLEVLALEMGMNKFQFIRWFKKQAGLTPFEYILLQRVEKSRIFLKQGIGLTEAALESGFYDQSHFSRYFKKFVGLSPSKYQSAILYKN